MYFVVSIYCIGTHGSQTSKYAVITFKSPWLTEASIDDDQPTY